MPTDEIKPIKPMVGFIGCLKNPNPKNPCLAIPGSIAKVQIERDFYEETDDCFLFHTVPCSIALQFQASRLACLPEHQPSLKIETSSVLLRHVTCH
jgi:hypothetical protein